MTYKELLENVTTPLNSSVPQAVGRATEMLVGPKSTLASKGIALAGLAALFYGPRLAMKAKRRAESELSRFT